MEGTTHTKPRSELPPTALAYIRAVEAALSGIEDEERAEVLDDLRTHIAELLVDGGHDLVLDVWLGPPGSYATELLASAGLDAPPPGPPKRPSLRARLAQRLRALWPAGLAAWLAELRPGWWVVRGYGMALLWTAVGGAEVSELLPIPQMLGDPLSGLIITAALVYISVEVGAGRIAVDSRLRRAGVRAAMVAAIIGLLATANVVASADRTTAYFEEGDFQAWEEVDRLGRQLDLGQRALTLPGLEPVTNIYAYDLQGNPLEEVLLYDGVGNPLVLQEQPDGQGFPFSAFGLQTDYERDAAGGVVPNLYPLSQYRVGGEDQPAELRLGPDAPTAPAVEDAPVVSSQPRGIPEVTIPVLPGAAVDEAIPDQQ